MIGRVKGVIIIGKHTYCYMLELEKMVLHWFPETYLITSYIYNPGYTAPAALPTDVGFKSTPLMGHGSDSR